MANLQGKIAVVTGCGRYKGIGRATALVLAAAGADVAVTDIEATGRRNTKEIDDVEASTGWNGLESLVAEIKNLGKKAIALEGDIGRKTDAERIVRETIDRLGAVDILVNNAGAPHG